MSEAALRDRPLSAVGWARPSPWLIGGIVACAVFGGLAVFGLVGFEVWGWICAALAVLAILDALALRRTPTPEVRRRLPDALAIGVEREVQLEFAPGERRRVFDVHDLHPGAWESEGLPRRIASTPGTIASVGYKLRPTARGAFEFEGVQLRLSSPLRLWRQSRVVGPPHRVRVFPNFVPLTRFALLSADQASRLVGAHLKRRRGQGTDFEQLREYRVGDSLRQIDWKATARAKKLISREYEDEKNQQVVLMLDTGRRMLARDGALGHFDQALDASLVVAYLALRQGDGVALHASGGDRRWVPAQRGAASIDVLLRAAYDLQPQAEATDYLAAATELSLLQRRRALVLWVTNVRDEDSEDLLAAARMLQKRHLVAIASLREQALDDILSSDAPHPDDAVLAGATARYLAERAKAHESLRRHHITVLDVTSAQLPAALVQQYLSVKRDGLL